MSENIKLYLKKSGGSYKVVDTKNRPIDNNLGKSNLSRKVTNFKDKEKGIV